MIFRCGTWLGCNFHNFSVVCLDKSNKRDLLSMMLCMYVVRTSKSEGTRLGFHVLSMGVERRTLKLERLPAASYSDRLRLADGYPSRFQQTRCILVRIQRTLLTDLASILLHLRRVVDPLRPNVLFSQVFVWMPRKQSFMQNRILNCGMALHIH